jgi:hypothetical protein
MEKTIAVTSAVKKETKNTWGMVFTGMAVSFRELSHTTKNTPESMIIKNKSNFFMNSFMSHLLSHTEFTL